MVRNTTRTFKIINWRTMILGHHILINILLTLFKGFSHFFLLIYFFFYLLILLILIYLLILLPCSSCLFARKLQWISYRWNRFCFWYLPLLCWFSVFIAFFPLKLDQCWSVCALTEKLHFISSFITFGISVHLSH